MPLDTFKNIGVLAEIIVDDALIAEIEANGSVWEDSALWRITYDLEKRLVELFHRNSGTRSEIKISGEQLNLQSFRFFSRDSGRQDDDEIWIRHHWEKIGM